MNIITISREFGSGGRELLPAVAEFALCWLRSARKNAPVPEGNDSQ